MFTHPEEHKIYGSVTVNAKWQIVIPADARERLGIKPWDQLLVTSKWDFILWFIKADNLQDFITIIEMDCWSSHCDGKDAVAKIVGNLKDHIPKSKKKI